ncbi:MAG: hypothetical protein Kow0022_10940 [Phycisphaerales bacterium]
MKIDKDRPVLGLADDVVITPWDLGFQMQDPCLNRTVADVEAASPPTGGWESVQLDRGVPVRSLESAQPGT